MTIPSFSVLSSNTITRSSWYLSVILFKSIFSDPSIFLACAIRLMENARNSRSSAPMFSRRSMFLIPFLIIPTSFAPAISYPFLPPAWYDTWHDPLFQTGNCMYFHPHRYRRPDQYLPRSCSEWSPRINFAECFSKISGTFLCLLECCVLHQHKEFIPTDPSGQIIVAEKDLMIFATSTITVSPNVCPKLSLTPLKLSISIRNNTWVPSSVPSRNASVSFGFPAC